MEYVRWADFILIAISQPEENSNLTYHNLIDWLSKSQNSHVFSNKPVFIVSTTEAASIEPNSMALPAEDFQQNGAIVLETFVLPEFSKNFKEEAALLLQSSGVNWKQRSVRPSAA